MDSKEIIHRREFFKRVANKTLPIIAVSIFPCLISCDKKEIVGQEQQPDDCHDCTGTCYGTCDSSCTGTCQETCDSSCSGGATGTTQPDTEEGISSADGTLDGYGYVDLGLSVKWAICNYGTSYPEGKGTYMEAYPNANNEYNYVEAALALMRAGYRVNDSFAGSNFDMATINISSKWKTPTNEQIKELIDNCNAEVFVSQGIKGFRLISKKNKKSIFFPITGKKGYKGTDEEGNSIIWSSTIGYLQGGSCYMGTMNIYASSSAAKANLNTQEEAAYYRIPIRPVTTMSNNNPSGCTGSSCSTSCSGSASGSTCSSCASNCSSGCKQSCDYNCASTCKNHCYGSCNDSCGGSCQYVSAGTKCSGCANTCYNRCYSACTYACSSSCESSCVNGSK